MPDNDLRTAGAILIGVFIAVLFPTAAFAASANSSNREGVAHFKENQFPAAEKKFQEAQSRKPVDPRLTYNLANSQYKQDKFEEALQSYSRVYENTPDPALKQKSIYNAGNALFKMGKLEEAISAYKKALELDSNDMDAKFNLEFAREQLKQKKEQEQKQQKNQQQKQDQKNSSSENQPQEPQNNQQQENKDGPQKNEDNQSASNQEPRPAPPEPSENETQQQLAAKPVDENMTPEEANHWLGSLTEDLKKYSKRQAEKNAPSIQYQGPDW